MTGRARREALTRARTRRLELDSDRAQRERHTESAAADVLVLREHRADRLQGDTDVESSIGLAMRSLVQAGVGTRDIALAKNVDPVMVTAGGEQLERATTYGCDRAGRETSASVDSPGNGSGATLRRPSRRLRA